MLISFCSSAQFQFLVNCCCNEPLDASNRFKDIIAIGLGVPRKLSPCRHLSVPINLRTSSKPHCPSSMNLTNIPQQSLLANKRHSSTTPKLPWTPPSSQPTSPTKQAARTILATSTHPSTAAQSVSYSPFSPSPHQFLDQHQDTTNTPPQNTQPLTPPTASGNFPAHPTKSGPQSTPPLASPASPTRAPPSSSPAILQSTHTYVTLFP